MLFVEVVKNSYSEDNRLLKRSKTLREYSMFIYFVNECLDNKMSLEEAVAASVRRAKEEGILVDFLNKYATEVEGMLTGITVNEYGKVMKKEGFEDGRAVEKREMARALKDKGVDIDIISETSGLSRDEIEKL